MDTNVHYGCGLQAPDNWINFDASPTLRLQKIPLLGKFVTKVDFPKNVLYGDIVKTLPGIKPDSCDAIYCSHVLEHLSLKHFRIALRNSFKYLKPGGIFRCVVPDLEFSLNAYAKDLKNDASTASIKFLKSTMLGLEEQPSNIVDQLAFSFGNYKHLWMWDKHSLQNELREAGFNHIRLCHFDDSLNPAFKTVENEGRFREAVAFECIK